MPQDLESQIRGTEAGAQPASTTLRTSSKVLGRITDGIYRRPESAVRELVANAYDADASWVHIQTDRPRFSRIVVQDNGHGMSPAALTHMLHNIGGSSKRSADGIPLGVTNLDDTRLSPGGRRLIGRIGIGLFSVAQLAYSFQIITKTEGDEWQTVADVVLRQWDEPPPDGDAEYEAGRVKVWRERADDPAAKGTSVILTSVRQSTVETLQSKGIWRLVDRGDREPPRFHIGDHLGDGTLREIDGTSASLPWQSPHGEPDEAFQSLVGGVTASYAQGERSPSLKHLLDNYLQMAWNLSLAVPLTYVHVSPFDISGVSTLRYVLSGGVPAAARPLDLPTSVPVSEKFSWAQSDVPTDGLADSFRVLLDDLELRRPLRFEDMPETSNAIKKPIIFYGQLNEDFPGVDSARSGGPLRFSAYLLWAPKIAPIDNVGCLIRLHGASGTGFDPSFLGYPVQETVKLRQMTCEVLVHEGLEAALNIDRESFNAAHPHVIRLTSWLHNAMTRSFTQVKAVAKAERATKSSEQAEQFEADLEAIVLHAYEEAGGEPEDIPEVRLAGASSPSAPVGDEYVFDRSRVLGADAYSGSKPAKEAERKVAAIVQVLAAYGLLDDLEPEDREALLADLATIVRLKSG